MDKRGVVLALVLEALGFRGPFKTRADREQVMKAMYLAGALGVPHGYVFRWYVYGAYSPDLAQDLHSLPADGAGGESLQPWALERTEVVRRLLGAAPAGRSPSKWARALADYHFLRHRSRKSPAEALLLLGRLHPGMTAYFDAAAEALQADPRLAA